MLRIELTLDEIELLHQLLEHCLEDLHEEIRHTDNRNYRERLREREATLRKTLLNIDVQARRLPA